MRALVCVSALLAMAGPALAAKPKAPPAAAAAAAASAGPTAADFRTPDPENVLVIDTNQGRILVELHPEVAPQAVARVKLLARQHFYDGQTFFRVIDGFMDQTGDPTNTGTGGSKEPDLPPEFSFKRGETTPMVNLFRDAGVEAGFIGALPVVSQPKDLGLLTVDHTVKAYVRFCPGVMGMARAEAENSANSQFYLMRGDTPGLDGKYTALGRVIVGQSVVNKIKVGEPAPPPQDQMTSVRVMSDLPAAERPKVRVIDPAGPWFRAEAARRQAAAVVGAPVCDMPILTQP